MAEVELDRLIVRIMGDGSDMKEEFENASKVAEDFSSGVKSGNKEIEHSSASMASEMANSAQTMSAFEGVSRGAGRSLSMTGRTMSQLGMGLAAMNPAMGQSVITMGMLTSGFGQVVGRTNSLKGAISALTGLAMNPLVWIAVPALLSGYGLWKKSSDDQAEANKNLENTLKRLKESSDAYAKSLSLSISLSSRPVGLGPSNEDVKGAASVAREEYIKAHQAAMVATREVANLEQAWINMGDTNDIGSDLYKKLELSREASRKAQSDLVLSRSAYNQIKGEADLAISQESRHSMAGADKRFRELKEDANTLIDELRKEISGGGSKPKTAGEQAVRHWKSQGISDPKVLNQIRDLTDQSAKVTEATTKAEKQELDYAEALKKTRIEQKYYVSELQSAAEPRNEELKSTIAASKAYDMWLLSHDKVSQATKDKAKADISLAESQKSIQKQIQEGTAIHEKHLLPDQKFALEKEKLDKVFADSKGVMTIRDYNSELQDLWLQTHKEYAVDLKLRGASSLSRMDTAINWQNQQRSTMGLDVSDRMESDRRNGAAGATNPAAAQINTAEHTRRILEILTGKAGQAIVLAEAN